jgi:sulfur-carrier protein
MKILFFGRLGDRIGREIELEAPPDGCTVAELRPILADLYPEARTDLLGTALRACVGDRVVPDDHRVHRGDAVEFFPPLSGG